MQSYTHTYICIDIITYKYVRVYIYIYTYVCVCVYVYLYMYNYEPEEALMARSLEMAPEVRLFATKGATGLEGSNQLPWISLMAWRMEPIPRVFKNNAQVRQSIILRARILSRS